MKQDSGGPPIDSAPLRLRAEGEELLVQFGAALRRLEDLTSKVVGEGRIGWILSQHLRMAEDDGEEVLKSWAMPPVSSPTASIFCD